MYIYFNRKLLSFLVGLCLFTSLSLQGIAKENQEDLHVHYWGKINGVWFQGPIQAIAIKNDTLFDLSLLHNFLGLETSVRGSEAVFQNAHHTLDLMQGRTAALLDGQIVLLKKAPILVEGHLMVPAQQILGWLKIPYVMDHGFINILYTSDMWKNMLNSGLTDNGKSSLGYIGVLDPSRMILATRPRIYHHTAGLIALYEGKRKTNKEFTLTKLRGLTDTSVNLYMEILPNGQVMQNLFQDLRPEIVVVETCSCAGHYNYATMFTVTEIGLTSIWHSQYSYDRIERSGKSWELISYRRENIPERPLSLVPYWEIRETWMGNQFAVTKEIYHAPDKTVK